MSRGPESEELNSTTTSSSEADYSGTASVCSEDHEDNDIVGTAERLLTREGSRKLIKPDLLAMSQLLNFDEVSDVGRYECHSLLVGGGCQVGTSIEPGLEAFWA